MLQLQKKKTIRLQLHFLKMRIILQDSIFNAGSPRSSALRHFPQVKWITVHSIAQWSSYILGFVGQRLNETGRWLDICWSLRGLFGM